jgi:hypothetical protein
MISEDITPPEERVKDIRNRAYILQRIYMTKEELKELYPDIDLTVEPWIDYKGDKQ